MTKPPTVEEADKELAEIEEQLRAYERLQSRKQVLVEYKSVLMKMGIGLDGAAPGAAFREIAEEKKDLATKDVARQVLASVPEMPLSEIVKKATLAGWKGSGNRRADSNRMYVAMHRRADIFENLGKGIWRLRK